MILFGFTSYSPATFTVNSGMIGQYVNVAMTIQDNMAYTTINEVRYASFYIRGKFSVLPFSINLL